MGIGELASNLFAANDEVRESHANGFDQSREGWMTSLFLPIPTSSPRSACLVVAAVNLDYLTRNRPGIVSDID